MNKIEEIFKSWRISFNPNDSQMDIASKRIEICDSCEFKERIHVGPLDIVTRCKVCGCALKAKMFTPLTYKDPGGTCPHQKWAEVEQEWLDNKEEEDTFLIPDGLEYYESTDGITYHFVILPHIGTNINIKCMSSWNIIIKTERTNLPHPLILKKEEDVDFVFENGKWIYQD